MIFVKQKTIITCSSCRCVAYCSKEHMEEDTEFHSNTCHRLTTAINDYIVQQELLAASKASTLASMIFNLVHFFTILPKS